jgi:hypothetical protein
MVAETPLPKPVWVMALPLLETLPALVVNVYVFAASKFVIETVKPPAVAVAPLRVGVATTFAEVPATLPDTESYPLRVTKIVTVEEAELAKPD